MPYVKLIAGKQNACPNDAPFSFIKERPAGAAVHRCTRLSSPITGDGKRGPIILPVQRTTPPPSFYKHI